MPGSLKHLSDDRFPETVPRGAGELLPTETLRKLVGEPKEFGKFENQGESGS